jgi:hypothetical protein
MSPVVILVLVFVVVIALVVGVGLFIRSSNGGGGSVDVNETEDTSPTVLPDNILRSEYRESFLIGETYHDVHSILTSREVDNIVLQVLGPTESTKPGRITYSKAPTTQDPYINPSTLFPGSEDGWNLYPNTGFSSIFKLSTWLSQFKRDDIPTEVSDEVQDPSKRVYELSGHIYIIVVRNRDSKGEKDLILVDATFKNQNDVLSIHAELAYFLLNEDISPRFIMFAMFSDVNYDWQRALENKWTNLLVTPINILRRNQATEVDHKNYCQCICSTDFAKCIEIEYDIWSTLRFTIYPQSNITGILDYTRHDEEKELTYVEPYAGNLILSEPAAYVFLASSFVYPISRQLRYGD